MLDRLDDHVRGIYRPAPTTTNVWELIPTPSRIRPWVTQYALPVRIRITDGAIEPLTAELETDNRFPASIAVAIVSWPSVVRGHMTHTLRGQVGLGSIYVYSPTNTERWVELVTKPLDMKEVSSTHRTITQLMGNDDPDQVAQHRQMTSVLLYEFTPTTIHPPSQLLIKK
jgi:hypothetical protein